MAKTEKLAFALLAFLLITGLAAKFYRLNKEVLPAKTVFQSAFKGKAKPEGKGSSPKEPEAPKIFNLNAASAQELEKLPYIGKPTAQKIIDYRSTHGPFKDKTDLLRVDGISISLYKKIESSLTLQ